MRELPVQTGTHAAQHARSEPNTSTQAGDREGSKHANTRVRKHTLGWSNTNGQVFAHARTHTPRHSARGVPTSPHTRTHTHAHAELGEDMSADKGCTENTQTRNRRAPTHTYAHLAQPAGQGA